MTLPEYALFFAATAAAALVGCVLVVFNPVPPVFLGLAGPLVRFCGREPGTGYGWFTREWLVGGLWPLTLAPLHLLNYRLLGWGIWPYLGLAFAAGVVLAFVVLIARSSPRPTRRRANSGQSC